MGNTFLDNMPDIQVELKKASANGIHHFYHEPPTYGNYEPKNTLLIMTYFSFINPSNGSRSDQTKEKLPEEYYNEWQKRLY